MIGNNQFAYCSNNPVSRCDAAGNAWYHWALGAIAVVGFAALTVATCGGSMIAAASAVGMVASGTTAFSTASTVAAAAFIGSATAFGIAATDALLTSETVSDFNNKASWGTVIATVGLGVLAATSAYSSTKTSLYRSVSDAEAEDIRTTGQFNLAAGGMESKQFSYNLAETRQFGNLVGQTTIVRVKVNCFSLNQFCSVQVDRNIFRSGTLTIYGDQLDVFNQLTMGTIRFMN